MAGEGMSEVVRVSPREEVADRVGWQATAPPLAAISTLYLCYFGLREPLVQTQVLPYLRQLAADGAKTSLLTFEPRVAAAWREPAVSEQRAKLAAEGIRWLFLPYHKRPSAPATAYDTLRGAALAARLVRREGIGVLHARAHLPLAMALLAQRWTSRARVVFDLRGLMAEEYADAGVWQENSPVYRAIKRLEQAGLKRADQIVVLTRKMHDWLVERELVPAHKIEVIPCCVDFSRFDASAQEQSLSDRFEVIYAGATTGLYLLEEMARFFLALKARQPGAFLRILTRSPAGETGATLERAGIASESFEINRIAPEQVPIYLRRARLGLSFRKPTFSQIAASPTKIPEYLAAGLPVVSNAGIGDTDQLLEGERVGVIVKSFDPETLAEAAAQAARLTSEPDLPARCIEVARRRFDLVEIGGAGYRNVYRKILQPATSSLEGRTVSSEEFK